MQLRAIPRSKDDGSKELERDAREAKKTMETMKVPSAAAAEVVGCGERCENNMKMAMVEQERCYI